MAKAKKSIKTPQMVRVCPKCKFASVSEEKSRFFQKMEITPSVYVCNKCGHTGYSFPEVESSQLKSFEKDMDRKHLRFKDDDRVEAIDQATQRSSHWDMISTIIWVLGVLSAILIYQTSGSTRGYWAAPITLIVFWLIGKYVSTKI